MTENKMNWAFEKGRICAADENGVLLAEATITHIGDGLVDIDHTYVAPELRGQGIAGEMMAVVAKHLKDNGLKAIASCSYARDWLIKHWESLKDIISDDIENGGPSCRTDRIH